MISKKRKNWLGELPTPRQIRFVVRTKADRKPCPKCGTLDCAVTTQPLVTYYGPARCSGCGLYRGLRGSVRKIDLIWLKEKTGLKTEADYFSALREKNELFR